MKAVQFNEHGDVYRPQDIDTVLKLSVNNKNLRGNSKGVYYYNIPCSFDIETTSFYRDLDGRQYTYEQVQEIFDKTGKKPKFEKIGIMYVWQFGINGNIIIGRTWQEFLYICDRMADALELSEKRHLIVYVHNLSYEFQFIRSLFGWHKVFSIDLRKPIYAITDTFIEFRCSYLLSGYSLAKLGSQLNRYKVSKLTGDLDYSLLRHSETPLTELEIGYCVNDVRVVMAYIQQQIEDNKNIINIPLTKTGFVRKYCRKNCLFRRDENGKRQQNFRYIELMQDLQITSLDEFEIMQRSFMGGFTHANANYSDLTVTDVASYDFTSSYPYVMIAEQFPMSRGRRVKVAGMKHFQFIMQKYLCIFDVEFDDIFARESFENYIPVSKCWIKHNTAENNGRLVAAEKVCLTITNIDYDIIKRLYSWGNLKVGQMWIYEKQYLPTEFVKSILHLYEKKTTLKGVKGKETEYLNSKEMLNSCYGMTVTNPLREEFTYNGVWDTQQVTADMKEELLMSYNQSRNRFLFYGWGIFVTAYARRNLFTGILECKGDYIYSDTDSIKILNYEKHADYFDAYNHLVETKLKKACKYHGIDFSLCSPKTIKGVTKMLGVWDFEGVYRRFKTLGAKRYMVEEENALTVGQTDYDYSLTVSGVNKRSAIPYLLDKYGDEGIFDAFTNYLDIPATATGKNIHTYVDYPVTGCLTDYLGNTSEFSELSGVHLEPTAYTLSLSVIYLNYLRGIKFKEL